MEEKVTPRFEYWQSRNRTRDLELWSGGRDLTNCTNHARMHVNDLIYSDIALFLYNYNPNAFPTSFRKYFICINVFYIFFIIQKRSTPVQLYRLTAKISYYISKARTCFGMFNIRRIHTKIWNSIEDN